MKLHSCAARGDLVALREQLAKGLPVDSRDHEDYTPLGRALCSPAAGLEIVQLLLASGADINARVEDSHKHMLDLAAGSGDLDKVQLLLDAGANIKCVSPMGYTPLIHAIYSLPDDESLLPMVDCLIKNGANLNSETDYSESPLSVASFQGRFDVVRRLLDAGANPERLRWNELMRAVVLGTVTEVQSLLDADADLDETDSFERTAWLLSCLTGEVHKIQLLYASGAIIDQAARCGRTALMHSAEKDKTDVLQWLVDHGANLNVTDDLGSTALMMAAQSGATKSVRILLDAGADPSPRNECGDNALADASNTDIVRMLCDAGEDITDIGTDAKRRLIGLSNQGELDLSHAEYESGKHPRFGKTNPDVMDVPFWKEMVRVGCSAWEGRAVLDDTSHLDDGPIWCLDRFGMSFTELPDGRFVQIGGEHEDFYDPDFCIYNDVIVHHATGDFQIMGYPDDLFPPTDFHSATYVDGQIYILGGLGYAGARNYGFTPCYRLECETWRIEPIETSGTNPGWIYQHKARLEEPNLIVICGGTICEQHGAEEEHVENTDGYRLDLTNMTWQRN